MRISCKAFAAIFLIVLSANIYAGTGVSFDQVKADLDTYITLEESSPVNGQDRYMGLSVDGVALLEVIGPKHDVVQASLMVGLPNDAPEILARNSAILIRFLKNVTPEWEGGAEWATAAISKVTANPGEKEQKVIGSKLITIELFPPLAMLSISLKEKLK
ncbi:hypothetical protein [Porticoccus sp.]